MAFQWPGNVYPGIGVGPGPVPANTVVLPQGNFAAGGFNTAATYLGGATQAVTGGGIFFGGNLNGRELLFDPGYNFGAGNHGEMSAMSQAFLTRFGITNAIRKNYDMARTISSPIGAIKDINDSYQAIGAKLMVQYKLDRDTYIRLGLSPEEATARADVFIQPSIMSELDKLKLKFPFSFAGGDTNVFESLMDTGPGRTMGRANKVRKLIK